MDEPPPSDPDPPLAEPFESVSAESPESVYGVPRTTIVPLSTSNFQFGFEVKPLKV
ncbi:Uncharacterised protein [Mycobacteroides abscessus subsp. abscessus]|nr:Uncharacterised protein [Mycobacteroides abscessus subsp. abscessus]